MKSIRLTGRNSRLSLLQIELVRQKIISAFPGIQVDVKTLTSKGDSLQDIPLHTVEGSDFFIREISDALKKGKADIAVHSLKDMSGEHFFGKNIFAVVDRDDARDVAIFNTNVEDKIRNGEEIVIGTCSPRREEMSTEFLKKALPQFNQEIRIAVKPIRGNVETRLRKLDHSGYDGTILATAGLNRMLRSSEDTVMIRESLKNKKLMLLPLVECVPAPCQGAVVAEADPSNTNAVKVLEKINDKEIYRNCLAEKQEAILYGKGCLQQFGVTTIHTKNGKYLYAAGKDAEGIVFTKWNPLPELNLTGSLFSTTDSMKDFFDYEWNDNEIPIDKPVAFIANYKAVGGRLSVNLYGKTLLTSGTKSWFELAKEGYWVTACADALGFEFLLPSLQMPLFDIIKDEILILTHDEAAERWREKGFHAISNYRLTPKYTDTVCRSIARADYIFWSSFSQFESYRSFAKSRVNHLCAGGETAELIKQQGISPVIFPTIKTIELWRRYFIPSHSAA